MPQAPSETYAARAKRGRPNKTFCLPRDVADALAARAAELGIAQSALVEEALRMLLPALGGTNFVRRSTPNASTNEAIAARLGLPRPRR